MLGSVLEKMQIEITCKTDRFNLSLVGEDFINDCCYGEDFSVWLVEELNKRGINADVICMEDYGWANQVIHEGNSYLMCVSGSSDENPENPNYGEWHILIEKNRKFSEIILRKNKISKNESICSILTEILLFHRLDAVNIEL